MIITDLLEYVGKEVEVHLFDGKVLHGKLEYIESFSDKYGWRKPKHFYICRPDGDWCFRAWHVDKIKIVGE